VIRSTLLATLAVVVMAACGTGVVPPAVLASGSATTGGSTTNPGIPGVQLLPGPLLSTSPLLAQTLGTVTLGPDGGTYSASTTSARMRLTVPAGSVASSVTATFSVEPGSMLVTEAPATLGACTASLAFGVSVSADAPMSATVSMDPYDMTSVCDVYAVGPDGVLLQAPITPDAAGASFAVRGSGLFLIYGTPAGPLTLTAARLPGAYAGRPYGAVVPVTGGSGAYAFSFSGPVPSWLSIDTKTGELSGTPPALETIWVGVVVRDLRTGETVTLPYRIDVGPAPLSIVTSASLPKARVGVGYRVRLRSSGAAGVVRWASQQALPEGLSLNPASGVLSGRPQTGGRYTFTVWEATSTAQTASKTFTLDVG